jgi:hypothetical protein
LISRVCLSVAFMVCYDQQVESGQLHFEITQRAAATPTSSYEQDAAAAAATPADQDIAEDGRISCFR